MNRSLEGEVHRKVRIYIDTFRIVNSYQFESPLQTSDAVNVALGKPANQTDTHGIYTADRAVDGNTSGDLDRDSSCTHTVSLNASSWWVNLQNIFLIRSVKIYNRITS
ncbi:hypothetical protein DPMN_107494, partial [Dreissena polymorpha]